MSTDDKVNHPKHYTSHPSGVECIEIAEHLSFNLGNAMKYIWRYDNKNGLEDLKKARWYVNREIERLSKEKERNAVLCTCASDPTGRSGHYPYCKLWKPNLETSKEAVKEKPDSLELFEKALRKTAAESKGGHGYWMLQLADRIQAIKRT